MKTVNLATFGQSQGKKRPPFRMTGRVQLPGPVRKNHENEVG